MLLKHIRSWDPRFDRFFYWPRISLPKSHTDDLVSCKSVMPGDVVVPGGNSWLGLERYLPVGIVVHVPRINRGFYDHITVFWSGGDPRSTNWACVLKAKDELRKVCDELDTFNAQFETAS